MVIPFILCAHRLALLAGGEQCDISDSRERCYRDQHIDVSATLGSARLRVKQWAQGRWTPLLELDDAGELVYFTGLEDALESHVLARYAAAVAGDSP
ncbi:hypothetical protein J2T57_001243 [Natronocella acetinitrilica]|uniref:Uncharacterized protein n=1 Tax=Natronocella acetinitrilica TaxID=414046 RepID=A0AAE3G3N8_9GAMM|nr:hypothetical protein [Natronocella acetinitrilica]MCP1674141.1 hypothetical protein [Natronocella acetinitrilica]